MFRGFFQRLRFHWRYRSFARRFSTSKHKRFFRFTGPQAYSFGSSPNTKRRILIYVGIPLLLGGIFWITHREPAPFTGRMRFIAFSRETEKKIFNQQADALIRSFKHSILPANHPDVKAVRKVGRRLLSVSGLTDTTWDFYVINSPIPNAFVTPNGKVVVFTGILPIMRDEDGMATILGHEIAHVVARHAAEQLSRSLILPLIQLIFVIFSGSWELGAIFGTLFFRLPFSRICEREADYIGLILMARACYDPEKAIEVWERFERVMPSQAEFLSTHPSPKHRKKNMEKWLPEVLKEREKSQCKPVESYRRRQFTAQPHQKQTPVQSPPSPIPVIVLKPPLEDIDEIFEELFDDDNDDF